MKSSIIWKYYHIKITICCRDFPMVQAFKQTPDCVFILFIISLSQTHTGVFFLLVYCCMFFFLIYLLLLCLTLSSCSWHLLLCFPHLSRLPSSQVVNMLRWQRSTNQRSRVDITVFCSAVLWKVNEKASPTAWLPENAGLMFSRAATGTLRLNAGVLKVFLRGTCRFVALVWRWISVSDLNLFWGVLCDGKRIAWYPG